MKNLMFRFKTAQQQFKQKSMKMDIKFEKREEEKKAIFEIELNTIKGVGRIPGRVKREERHQISEALPGN